ncbi:MAG: TVP38/TMEM64 family protein [Bauldia sp.]
MLPHPAMTEMTQGHSPDTDLEAADAPSEGVAPVRRSLGPALLRWLPVLVLIAGGVVVYLLGVGDYISLSEIIKLRNSLHTFVSDQLAVAIAAYCGLYILAVVFSIPGGSVLTIVGGLMFGGLAGGLLTTVAATAGSLTVYFIAKTALSDWMTKRTANLGRQLSALAEGFRDNAFYVIVVMRLIPVMPYWASNAVPALFGVSVRTFVLATLVGLLPWTVSFAFFGDALEEIIDAQEVANPGCADAGTCEVLDMTSLTSGPVLTGLAIALASLLPVAAHWWVRRRRRAAGTPPPA